MCAPCPLMFASIRMTGTVLLRPPLFHFFLEAGGTLLHGPVLVAFREDSAPSTLRLDAALLKLFDPAISFGQLVAVFVDVPNHRVELVARQAGHGLVDEIEIVTPVH